MNSLKTTFLLGTLFGLFMLFGALLGGSNGIIFAFIFALILNGASYWFSDKIVLSMYRAKELTQEESPRLHQIVAQLAVSAGIPKPRIALVPLPVPNAFATGRNPEHAVVAVTRGLLDLLEDSEVEGVLAHEISHIKNRDTMIQCLAAALGGAIVMLAHTARWGALFGIGRSERDGNIFELLLMAVLAPIAALLIQMAISRSREFVADESAARISHKPLELAGALRKLDATAQRYPIRGNAATSHLFIVNPFRGGLSSLLSTHPPIAERIARLEKMTGF